MGFRVAVYCECITAFSPTQIDNTVPHSGIVQSIHQITFIVYEHTVSSTGEMHRGDHTKG
jgi:hypothetical protein